MGEVTKELFEIIFRLEELASLEDWQWDEEASKDLGRLQERRCELYRECTEG
ncbi:hypothetical protein [Bacillus toyonensis]|uniref:hypothetical protein n=1 Tax=Bacillus toyonensis TaxID=155322 RepID=UPI00159BB8E1|nr:hypothetical protein [Bacillus toyonensis]